jgi:hypothetical protein
MAIANRSPTGGTIIQSDQDVQSTLWVFTRRARDSSLVASTAHRRLP